MFTKAGEWQLLNQSVHDVCIEQLNTKILSLDFFDRLFNNKVVREQGGYIKKCVDEYKDEFVISDELRKVKSTEIKLQVIFHLWTFLGFNYG